jgi:CheY-like chemotaxis protein
VDSTQGRGSTFWLELPFERAPESPSWRETTVPATLASPLAHWHGARVLLVEDNPTNLMVARLHLEHYALTVETAVDGVEALEAMRRWGPDLVLMDCQMPRMDGYEAVRQRRALEAANPSLTRLPIIALSADAMDEDRRRGREAGFDDHLAKPFSRRELGRLLERWLHAFA